jgi:hypothetical protein
MTKSQELSILDEAISKLGTDSYLGPWLRSVRDEVEGMVKSDIFPTEITISRTHEHCLQLMANADTYCRQVGENARKVAEKIKQDALSERHAIYFQARLKLSEALTKIPL